MTEHIGVSTDVSSEVSSSAVLFASLDLYHTYWNTSLTLANGDVDIPPRME